VTVLGEIVFPPRCKGDPGNGEAASQGLVPAGIVPEAGTAPPAGAPHAGGSFIARGFGRTSQTAGADRDAAVSARRLFRRHWLGLRRQLRENSDWNARSNRRGRSDESGGPPLFALSLEV